MQVFEDATSLEDMSAGELAGHAEALDAAQRAIEIETLRAAAQWAVLHGPDTVSPVASVFSGREKAVQLGGEGTPLVAEWSPGELGARFGRSWHWAREIIADALDLQHRLPLCWARVEAGEVRVSYARYVARRSRRLAPDQAAVVDARVVEVADGRVTWSRFETLVEAAVAAADPVGTARREDEEAQRQFANAVRRNEHGMAGFYVRATFPLIARLDAVVACLADAMAAMGDEESLDARRVKAVLLLTSPLAAARFLADFQAWKDRPADPDEPATDEQAPSDPDEAPPPPPDRAGRAGSGLTVRVGDLPEIDWSPLLPRVVLHVHTYRGADGTGIARVEEMGPVTETWIRTYLGPQARFSVTEVLDLAGQAPVDSYEIPDRHRRAVHLLMPADVFPFSANLTRGKQVDHTVPFTWDAEGRPSEPGQSRIGNYGPMTTLHHRAKTFGRWQVRQPFPGIFIWRDPHGAFYLVDHTGTRRIPAADDEAA